MTGTAVAADAAGVWHVERGVTPRGVVTWCGRLRGEFPESKPARQVQVEQRCGATGCKQHWPADLRAVS